MFLNRTRELGYLSERYAAGRAEIVVLYGRRHVGKSALLFEWSDGKPCIFFFARRADKATLLGEFSRAIRAFSTDNPIPDDFTYPSWGAAFSAIAELSAERRLVVILDEFPYLVEADPELPTLLQREWDLRLQHTQVFLVLSGSIQSVIQQQVLDPTAPLYRRHTWPFELKPLALADLPAFFPRYTAEQLVETFAVLGGMPYYLVSVDPQVGLLTNIKRHILAPQGSLFAEVRLQLHEELRGDIEDSLAILRAIAGGAHRRADIARLAGLPVRTTDHRLATLVELGILEYRRAIERIRNADRWGAYHLPRSLLPLLAPMGPAQRGLPGHWSASRRGGRPDPPGATPDCGPHLGRGCAPPRAGRIGRPDHTLPLRGDRLLVERGCADRRGWRESGRAPGALWRGQVDARADD